MVAIAVNAITVNAITVNAITSLQILSWPDVMRNSLMFEALLDLLLGLTTSLGWMLRPIMATSFSNCSLLSLRYLNAGYLKPSWNKT